MIVVNSSALITVLRRKPEADDFLQVIASADRCYLSAVSLLEISMVLARLDALVVQSGMQIVAQDAEQAEAAWPAFLRHGKGHHPAALNLGDCAPYALAKILGLPLLYKGNDFPKTNLVAVARRDAAS